MACCNSIFVLQWLILRLHDMCLILGMMCLIMHCCVFGAIAKAMLIIIVFFYSRNERFLYFCNIDLNFTIV